MQMVLEELAGGITRVALDGRFDIGGAEAVDLKINVIAGTKKFVLLDMEKVTFLGSMGLRTILTAARTVKSRGGKMAIFAPDEQIVKVLITSGVGALLSINPDREGAVAFLQ
ncbi:MAG: STAS domain-containing protein [Bryobacteraceae bacterium]